jgi:hypothetical protein
MSNVLYLLLLLAFGVWVGYRLSDVSNGQKRLMTTCLRDSAINDAAEMGEM